MSAHGRGDVSSGGGNASNRDGQGGGLLEWAREHLPHYFNDEPAAFHAEFMNDLEDRRRRLIARVAPRGHAKSTCAALALPLWAICQRRSRNIVIVTHEESLAAAFLRDIRIELESNEAIISSYGELAPLARAALPVCNPVDPQSDEVARQGDGNPARRRRSAPKWSESLLICNNGVAVHAKGVGGSIRGTRIGPNRPDLIICDDIEKDALVDSSTHREKLEHWLRRAVIPALAPHGRLVLIGSILHFDSLLSSLRDRKRFPGWDYRVYRAIEPVLSENGSWDLRPLWPARWPLVRLDEERERIGSLAFEQEYMGSPIDASIQVFTPAMLKRYDERELEGRDLATLIAIDPATGVSGGDFFAIWVGDVDLHDGVIFTRELRLERIAFVEQVRRIRDAYIRWNPLKIGIETTAYQVALKHALDELGRVERLYMPIVELRFRSFKRSRIESIAPLLESGSFRLPRDLDPEAELQFLQFPKARHDDAPDVCVMGVELARSLREMPNEEPSIGRIGRSLWQGW